MSEKEEKKEKDGISWKRIIEGVIITAFGSIIVAFIIFSFGILWNQVEDMNEKVYKDYKDNFRKLNKNQQDIAKLERDNLALINEQKKIFEKKAKVVDELVKVNQDLLKDLEILNKAVTDQHDTIVKLAKKSKAGDLVKNLAKPKRETKTAAGIQVKLTRIKDGRREALDSLLDFDSRIKETKRKQDKNVEKVSTQQMRY